MQTTLQGARYTPLVYEQPAPAGEQWTPEEYNRRLPLQFSYSIPPDPAQQGGAYGDIRTRPAMRQIAGFFHPFDYVMEDRFVFTNLDLQPGAWVMPDRQQPFDQRSNIEVPPHVAYGSLFTSDQGAYGYG